MEYPKIKKYPKVPLVKTQNCGVCSERLGPGNTAIICNACVLAVLLERVRNKEPVMSTIDTVGDLVEALSNFDNNSKIALIKKEDIPQVNSFRICTNKLKVLGVSEVSTCHASVAIIFDEERYL